MSLLNDVTAEMERMYPGRAMRPKDLPDHFVALCVVLDRRHRRLADKLDAATPGRDTEA